MVRLCGAALGFLAFTVTILLGLLANNTVEETLLRAIWALVIFCLIGLSAGWVAYRVLDEHALHRHREMFEPLEPSAEPESGATDDQKPMPSEAGGQEAAPREGAAVGVDT